MTKKKTTKFFPKKSLTNTQSSKNKIKPYNAGGYNLHLY